MSAEQREVARRCYGGRLEPPEIANTLGEAGIVMMFDDAGPYYRRFYAGDPFGSGLEPLAPHHTPIA